AADAIAFNSRTISDPAEIEMLRDILGLAPTPAVVDADFVRAVATYQAGYGLTADGKVGPLTRRRLSGEILTESAGLPAGGLGGFDRGSQSAGGGPARGGRLGLPEPDHERPERPAGGTRSRRRDQSRGAARPGGQRRRVQVPHAPEPRPGMARDAQPAGR